MMAEYEFSQEDGRIFNAVSMRCYVQAILLAYSGVIGILTSLSLFMKDQDLLLQTIVVVIQASMFIIMGVVFFRPADNLRKISKTEGRDITELMRALKDLSWGFLVLFLLVLVMIVLDVAYILVSQ